VQTFFDCQRKRLIALHIKMELGYLDSDIRFNGWWNV